MMPRQKCTTIATSLLALLLRKGHRRWRNSASLYYWILLPDCQFASIDSFQVIILLCFQPNKPLAENFQTRFVENMKFQCQSHLLAMAKIKNFISTTDDFFFYVKLKTKSFIQIQQRLLQNGVQALSPPSAHFQEQFKP